jgi:hypothetical protein
MHRPAGSGPEFQECGFTNPAGKKNIKGRLLRFGTVGVLAGKRA